MVRLAAYRKTERKEDQVFPSSMERKQELLDHCNHKQEEYFLLGVKNKLYRNST